MLEFLPTPTIFAHRGACAFAPENTLASFELAVQTGADAIELDVKLTRDNEAVVIHDPTVDRTTNGTGKVNQINLSDLKQLDAGSYFGTSIVGERIPTLDEVFESVSKRIFINVELTNYASGGDDLIPVVANIVKRHNLSKGVLFSSFTPRNLVMMKKLLPQTPVGLLCLSGIPGILTRSSLYLNTSPGAIHPYLNDVSEKLVNREHARGRRIHVWTVNGEENLRRMMSLNVDGIFTDDPEKALIIAGRK